MNKILPALATMNKFALLAPLVLLSTPVLAQTETETDSATGYTIVMFLLYLLPAIIASVRKHHNANAIFILNFLLGWSILAWIIALVWAFTSPAHAASTRQ